MIFPISALLSLSEGLIVVLWRAGLRINEALSLTETDLDERRGLRCI
jgi:hypothetical protein